MKKLLGITLASATIAILFFIVWERSWDQRCDYYAGLPNPTETMKEVCPNIK